MCSTLRPLSSKIVYAKGLPVECTKEMIEMIFSQCNGFQEVRLPPGNRNIAFIEFEEDIQASMAQKQLNGFQLSQSHQLELEIGESQID